MCVPPPKAPIMNRLCCILSFFLLPLQCSKLCGGGVKSRKVRCQQLLALGEIADKPPKLCPKNSPDTARNCNSQVGGLKKEVWVLDLMSSHLWA